MSTICQLDPILRFPNAERLALEALLGQGRTGEIAFQTWLAGVDIEHTSARLNQLLPLLYMRYYQGRPGLVHYPRVKGAHRQAHVRNSLILSSAQQAAAYLTRAGIKVLLLKGGSLALTRYPHAALRPMGDADFLVPAEDFERATALLERKGWRARHNAKTRARILHSIDYVARDGSGLDLHRQALVEVDDPTFGVGLFTRARPFTWGKIEVLIPSAEDEALLCLVSATRELEETRLIWVMDLYYMMMAQPSLDWRALWDRAIQFGLGNRVLHALQIAGDLRGNESIEKILSDLIAQSPQFERHYLKDIVSTGSTYGIDDNRRADVDRALSYHQDGRSDSGSPETWATLCEKPAGFGTIGVFKIEAGAIKALHLRWRHLPMISALFSIKDRAKWDEILRQSPKTGEGTLDIRPGILEPRPQKKHSRSELKAELSVLTDLPQNIPARGEISIPIRVRNGSDLPWETSGIGRHAMAVTAYMLERNRLRMRRTEMRTYIRPQIVKENYLSFLEPGAEVICTLNFTAPAKPGDYKIQFDLALRSFKWLPYLSLGLGRPEGWKQRTWNLRVSE